MVAGLSLKDGIEKVSNLASKGQFEKARDLLSELVKRNPDNYEVWNDLGVVPFTMGDTVTAEKCLKKALSLNQDYDDASKNLNLLYTVVDSRETYQAPSYEFAPDLNKKAVVWYSTMKCNMRCPYCLKK